MHADDSLDCGHYFSDVFDTNTGIWWHCDDDNIIQTSDLPEGVYIRESHKKNKRSDIRIKRCVIFVVYIRTSQLIKSNTFLKGIIQHVQNPSYEESN